MALVGGQDREPARRGCRGDGDVLEAGIVGTCAIENGASFAGLLYPKSQDTFGIEVFDCGKPASQSPCLRRRADPMGTGNTRLNFGDGHGR